MSRLILTLLGGFEVRADLGQPVTVPTRKAQALLAYLALTAGQVHPRDKLAALLWPDTAPAMARNALRQTLFVLRKALSPDGRASLVMTGDAVTGAADAIETDVAAFERAVAEATPAALEHAAVLYRGDLLAGLGVVAPTFEEWLLTERERLRELALEGFARLLAHQRAAGNAASAIQTALRLLALDPLQEAVHRTLMRLYVQVGRRDTALRQYQECVKLLQHELDVEPEAETKELYQQILRRRPVRETMASITFGSTDTPLVGRRRELGRLHAALGDAWMGGGRVVAVVGEAGIGKSRLVAELASEAQRRGGAVLIGRCYETEQILPFGPWISALREGGVVTEAKVLNGLQPRWRAELRRLFSEPTEPGPRTDAGPANSLRLFEALAELLGSIAVAQPLVIVLEDCHWADDMTLRFLAFFARRLYSATILVAISVREEELEDRILLRTTLDELASEGKLERVAPARFGRDETLTLIRLFGRTGMGTRAAEADDLVWKTSGGNPFIAVETLRAIGEGVAPGASGSVSVPTRVREMIAQRLDRLSEHARELVRVAAIIGREFEFLLLHRAAGLGEHEAAVAMEELVRRRIVHDVGDRFDFTHDCIRDVVSAGLLAPRRQLLHAAVARALEGSGGGDPVRHCAALGAHYREAGLWQQAAVFLRQAGRHATDQGAYREAAVLLEQAREAIGHLGDSVATLQQAVDVRLDLRNALLPLGDFPTILRRLEEAAPIAERLGDRRRQVRALAFLVDQLRMIGAHDRMLSEGRRALTLAESLGELELLILSLTRLGQVHHLRGEYPQARELFKRSLEISAGVPQAERLGLLQPPAVHSRYSLALTLIELGAFDDARTVVDECMALARDLGQPVALTFAWAVAGTLALQQGQLAVAIERLEQALDWNRRAGDAPWASRFAAMLGYAYALVGDPARGVAQLAHAVERAAAMGMTGAGSLVLSWVAEARLLQGDISEATDVAEHAIVLAERHGERGHLAWALRVRAEAQCHDSRSDIDEAARTYGEALTLAEQLGMRPLAARCRLGLGLLYRHAGRRADADRELLAARERLATMGMQAWLAHLERAAVGA